MEGNIDIATGLIWFVAFLFSTTVHEAMHAFAALLKCFLRFVHVCLGDGGNVRLGAPPVTDRSLISGLH